MPEYIKFYFKDFLTSLDVQNMDTVQVGAYCLLLFNSLKQREKGYLPVNEDMLMEITRMHRSQWNNNKTVILKKFSVSEKGYYNKKMIKVIKEQKQTLNTDAENEKIQNSKKEYPIYHPLQEYIVKYFRNIQLIKDQLTYEQCVMLRKKFSAPLIEKKLIKMENTKGIEKKYNSVFITLRDWCEKE